MHKMPSRCHYCGGWVRPGVVWFGEPLPGDAWDQAIEAVGSSYLMLSIGSSAVVYPAAVMPFDAAKRGACVIQVDLDRTVLDRVASYNLRGKAREVMAAAVEATWGNHAL